MPSRLAASLPSHLALPHHLHPPTNPATHPHRRRYIDTLKALAEAYKDRPFSWLWAEGAAQPGLEANLEVGGFGYPAVIAFTPKDQRYSTLR